MDPLRAINLTLPILRLSMRDESRLARAHAKGDAR
jgi:hypothetical protein